MHLYILTLSIAAIIDKTAVFVGKNGREFEERILQKERHNPKFTFLAPADPYHAYYDMRLQELVEGGQEAIARLQHEIQQQQQAAMAEQKGAEVSEGSAPLPAPSQPEALQFTLEIPNISPLDLDILKLTARYVGRNGLNFQALLARKEAGNVQFDFLRPGHSLHRLYCRLVEQYGRLIHPESSLTERIQQCQSKYGLLEGIRRERVGYARWAEDRQRREQAAAEREREEYDRISWGEFVVVETIDFTAADKNHLPPPLSLPTITSMSLLQRQDLWKSGSTVPSDKRSLTDGDDEEMEIEPTEKKPKVVAGVQVRYDYKPKASTQTHGGDHLVTCSICNQQIPSSQIQEHMRVELLDSKWAEQRQSHLSKHTDTNILASGTDVTRNLAAMSSRARGVGVTGGVEGKTATVWDGQAESVGAANREASIRSREQVKQEMAALQMRGGDVSLDPHTGIGPRIPQAPMPIPTAYGYPPYGYPQQPVNQQYPSQQYPPQGYPTQQYPPQGYPPSYPYPYQQPQQYAYPPGAYPPPQNPSYPAAAPQGPYPPPPPPQPPNPPQPK